MIGISGSAESPDERPGAGRARFVATVLFGGGIAGTLDILDAFVVSAMNGVGPARVLRYIASGVLGAGAARGGTAAAALGLALHFIIALGAATVYWAASRRLRVLVRHPILCGLMFGLAVFAVMRFVIVPLSLVRPAAGPVRAGQLLNQLGIHALGVGLPIAWFAAWSARRR